MPAWDGLRAEDCCGAPDLEGDEYVCAAPAGHVGDHDYILRRTAGIAFPARIGLEELEQWGGYWAELEDAGETLDLFLGEETTITRRPAR